ncbi:hypothetical protein PtrSN002B_000656 [Pyrenophora tritici-repentis]|nr:hypothetical protein PtrV1_07459 [Pyrenophora tritici-repentis]KAF7448523.1 hypothetical protein A1F99_078870 [Pyrenophora tritici-repentis]KAG9384577.1 hypothetical protein A1F94_004124 [Pyrenophora tritici-repentis]KAI1541693.1 hypothetical protein PtrSN001C_004450 [Pyrenophora tritici-repentis]KAI1548547.1 hypothetical protein PtrSN001A_001170 [Pyrenophora tritici-repentis]
MSGVSDDTPAIPRLEGLHTPHHHGPCFLTRFATELIQEIIERIPPASHLDFACTCKKIFADSSDILERHHVAHDRYSVSSDIDPITVPTLVRSALGYGDPILAWHVRSLEIWYDRKHWWEWKSLKFDIPIDQDTNTSPISWGYIPGETDDYLERLGQGWAGPSLARVFEARSNIEAGGDAHLKANLIANCPRLQDVKLVMPARYEMMGFCCIRYLGFLIDHVQNQGTSWPPGLQNLRNIAVGVISETWMDSVYDPTTQTYNTVILAHLFKLPSIEKIYFRDLVSQEYDQRPWGTIIPAKSSSLKHLFLDNCSALSQTFCNALFAAPSALISCAFRAGSALLEDADMIITPLEYYQNHTLESLMFYGFGSNHDNSEHIRGYRCHAFRPAELEKFTTLKQVCMNTQDTELDAFYEAETGKKEDETDGAWLERFFALRLPKTLEVLVLWDGLADRHIHWEPNAKVGFENAVIGLVTGRYLEEGEPKRPLEAICLADVERKGWPVYDEDYTPPEISPEDRDTPWFTRAVAVAREHGVDLHTMANRVKMLHQHSFPRGLDRWDFRSAPWYGEADGWAFDVYLGRRVPGGRE